MTVLCPACRNAIDLEVSRCDCGFEIKSVNGFPNLTVDFDEKGKTFSNYSPIAPYYHETRGADNIIHKQTADFIYDRYVGSDKVVLDLGAGTGIPGYHLAIRGANYIAGDASIEMLSVFKEFAEKADLNNVTFLVMNALNIPLPDDSIDVVTVRAVFHHIKDYKKVISEIRRILKPSGCLLLIQAKSTSADPDYIAEIWSKYEELLSKHGKKLSKTLGPNYKELETYIESAGGKVSEPEQWFSSNPAPDLQNTLRVLTNLALPHLRDIDEEINRKAMAELDLYFTDKYGENYASLKTNKEVKQGVYAVSFD